MKKLRLLLFSYCNRSCEGCCNKNWDLEALPKLDWTTLDQYEEILLTGGEPMLQPDLILDVASKIRVRAPKAKIYVYTAKVDNIDETQRVLENVDGLTVTLHEQKDVEPFAKFDFRCAMEDKYKNKSLRLNVFGEVKLRALELPEWKIKDGMEWIKDCPLPENEDFCRI